MERVLAAAVLWLIATGTNAADICAPNADPTFCVVLEQRDNALADAATAEAGRRREMAARAAEVAAHNKDSAWWKVYAAKLPDGDALKMHIEAACGWKGATNKPTADLCAWWKGANK